MKVLYGNFPNYNLVTEWYKRLTNIEFIVPKEYRKQHVYTVEGFKDTLKFVFSHPDTPPVEAIERYINKMERASENAKTRESSYMFACYKDVAEHIYDIMISY